MMWRRTPMLPILLLLGNVLLVWAIARVWWVGGEDRLAPRSRPKVAAARVPGARAPQNIGDFRVIATKDLFSPDREGPAPDVANGQGQGNLDGLSLTGVLIVGPEKVAIVRPQSGPARRGKPAASGQVEVLRVGERWEGFTVVKITPEAVILQGRDGQKTLKFPE
jgi:hypothetical protein